MPVIVEFSSKAASDLAVIKEHIALYNGAKVAGKVIRALVETGLRLGTTGQHRLGEELDGYDFPLREVHKNVVLDGDYEHVYEIIPAYSTHPSKIVVLRVWDTRQDR